MDPTIESKNKETKHLSLKLSIGSSISVTTKQLNVIGLPSTSNIALISRLLALALACSISLRALRHALIVQERPSHVRRQVWGLNVECCASSAPDQLLRYYG